MRPEGLKTRIFLDGGDPGETREVLGLLGFLDGQTTNPTLIAKNPDARRRLEQGGKFSAEEIYRFYKSVVREISAFIPEGSVSVEVYADRDTTAEKMLLQGKEMSSWIPNAHIKFPSSREGLRAAEQAVREGLRVNMTLCFTQEQAAAVYAATRSAEKGTVFVSPFIGRLDDRGENGMDIISNIIRMYSRGDGHVEVLTASVRTSAHMYYALKLGSDIITAPFRILKEWGEQGLRIPGDAYEYNAGTLMKIPYKEIALSKKWQDYNISHDLTDKGIEKFSEDWNSLIT
ncbi:MAG: transaldolase [Nitrospiraceae bacterium]|nr:MAG: transaldolase [Nitrospiraceae bacterium]